MRPEIELLQRMVRIDSRNLHPIDWQGARESNEEGMVALVKPILEELGFSIEIQYPAPHRPTLIAHRGTGKRAAFGLTAHADTVGVEGMVIPPFEPTIKDGMLYGRGSCDTKASMAAMLTALRCIIEEGIDIDLMFVCMASEETGCQGSLRLDLSKYNCGGFIVGEPTSCSPVVGHKRHCTVEFICRGKAVHGSNPDIGDNAILKCCRLVEFFNSEIIPYYRGITHPLFAQGCTLAPTMINGGIKANIIPDSCSVTYDMRFLAEAGSFDENMKMILERAEAKLGFPLEVGYTHYSYPLKANMESPFVQSVCAAAGHCGVDGTPRTVAYGTDAGCLSHKGIDCVVLGPGDIKVAHSALEYVPVAEVEKAVEIYVEAARLYARGAENG